MCNMIQRFWGLITALMLALTMQTVLAQSNEPMRLEVDANPLVFQTNQGDKTIELEIADTDESRMRGLMFRTDLPQQRGMLFDFKQVRLVIMWMKNTPLPLDMVFLHQDGTIAVIRENTTPFSENIVSSGEPVAYVIELNAGMAKTLGLQAGDKAVHPAICGRCD
ncbi:DUF192 domain-containing protein [Brucellaceae bacterium C25G]